MPMKKVEYINKISNILTFDVEEWFHILDLPTCPEKTKWIYLESRLEYGLERFLEGISGTETSCTFFILGWVAEHYPRIVKRIASSNNEIAAHGYGHELITKQSPRAFREDIRKAKTVLEDIIGKPITGYRGPGFSITKQNTWVFETILSEGFTYDATLYAGKHGHGGISLIPSVPFRILTPSGPLEEYPVPTITFGPINTAFSGGGYFRLFPEFIINRFIQSFNAKGKPVLSYLHPRDLDPDTPRLSMPINRKIRCYINLSQTFRKLRKIVNQHSFVSISNWRNLFGKSLPTIELSHLGKI